MFVTITEFIVLQEHIGDNGGRFDAWSFKQTSDPIRAVLEANEDLYRGRPLGKVKKIKLEQHTKWVEENEYPYIQRK